MEIPPKDSPYQLIVEGPDDRFFFGAFQTKMQNKKQINERAFIVEMDGIDQIEKLKGLLGALAQRSDPVKAIGLICDADNDPDEKFSRMRRVIEAVPTLPIPSQIGIFQAGASGQPRVGILVLPHDRRGIRETLCLEAIFQSQKQVMSCVDAFMNCVVETGNQPHEMEKARLLAYLAAQNDTDARIGIAVERGYIPWESPVFKIIRQFLKDLTEPTS